MRQNRKKQTTSSETIREKHACPNTASKLYQGTGKNRFDSRPQKTTGTRDTKDPKDGDCKNRIWSQGDYEASPLLDAVINSFDPSRTRLASDIINKMHEHFAYLIIEQIRDQGIPFEAVDGHTFTFTITFTKKRPEGK